MSTSGQEVIGESPHPIRVLLRLYTVFICIYTDLGGIKEMSSKPGGWGVPAGLANQGMIIGPRPS
jgi:hypothetical protein